MKNLIVALFVLLCSIVAEAATIRRVSGLEACHLASRVIGDKDFNYDYYYCKTVLPDSVPTFEMNFYDERKCWLVFVDEEPNTGWEHPCKYVYISAYESPTDFDYFVIDSMCPPSNLDLKPTNNFNRYGDKAAMKPSVPKVLSNNPNPAAGNTYAVILNGGMCKTSNNERYWNDCSFIYKTLRNTYEIPKPNIKVIMSDGTDEAEDMNKIVGGFCSSPLDLDDDSIPDVEYAATKTNLQTVFNEMAQTLTDDDHLLIYVTGHGGYDIHSQSSYMYLWDKVKLYPNELNSYLEPINAGFISIVMGQCNSGGFIEPLKKTNRIIATACAENERSYGSTTIPFDEFLYHWTSAVNGYDGYGTEVYKNGTKFPIMSAQIYAAEKDSYANGSSKYAKETPQINYFMYSNVYKLSLKNIPPVVDLCFDNYKIEKESKLITRSYGDDEIPYYRYDNLDKCAEPGFKYWNNPYIWLRNNRDGAENQTTEKLEVEEDKPVYIYVKVRNNGVKDYTTKDAKVRGYWAKSNFIINEYGWKGYVDPEDVELNKNIGGGLSGITLKTDIPAGEYNIEYLKKTFENDDIDEAQKPDFNMCVLLYVVNKEMSSLIPFDEDQIAEVWNTNKLGQSNVLSRFNCDSLFVDFTNTSKTHENYRFDVDVKKLQDVELELSIKLSPDIETLLANTMMYTTGSGPLRIQNNSTAFDIIGMTPYQTGKVGLECHFLANEDINEQKVIEVDMGVSKIATGKCMGGETFRIIQEPRPAINPLINSVHENGKTTLTATNVSENVIYKWYDEQGTLVGEGETFAVPAGVSAMAYRVKAEALSDGAISYSAMAQAESSAINSVQSNYTALNVIFEGPVNGGTTLRLTSATGNVPVTEYSVESGSTTYSIPANNLPSGVYQVTMYENGVVAGVKKFTK